LNHSNAEGTRARRTDDEFVIGQRQHRLLCPLALAFVPDPSIGRHREATDVPHTPWYTCHVRRDRARLGPGWT
jgi:hypothetical protein